MSTTFYAMLSADEDADIRKASRNLPGHSCQR